jgi:hypothetical protein
MPKPNNNGRMKVKLTHGIVTGPGTMGKVGDVVEFDIWTARHLIVADRAVEYKGEK